MAGANVAAAFAVAPILRPRRSSPPATTRKTVLRARTAETATATTPAPAPSLAAAAAAAARASAFSFAAGTRSPTPHRSRRAVPRRARGPPAVSARALCGVLEHEKRREQPAPHAPWSPTSWREKPIQQQPDYPDESALADVEERLHQMPPLVFPGETRKLKTRLAQAARGEAFVLQGGDCAETFADFSPSKVHATFRLLIAQVIIMSYSSGLPSVKIGRIAGQFAKPRSSPLDGGLPSFRGDIVHSSDATEAARVPDPERLIKAYSQSAAGMNLIRALAKSSQSMMDWLDQVEEALSHSGVYGKDSEADGLSLSSPPSLSTSSSSSSSSSSLTPAQFQQRARDFLTRMDDALRFVCACGLDQQAGAFIEPEFFTSHEALLLGYEEALTHRFRPGRSYSVDDAAPSGHDEHFDTSAHLLWIGERTRQLDAAHVEFMRGIANPIGLKVSGKMRPDELLRLVDVLNPSDEPGRLLLVTRMGADEIDDKLPPLVRAIKEGARNVCWTCDPMHGNTVKTASGYKTRPFERVMSEIRSFFAIHAAEGTVAAGLHLEMTGEDVTECTGGTAGITEECLAQRYWSACDPRLNAKQALEVAFTVGEWLRARERGKRRQQSSDTGNGTE